MNPMMEAPHQQQLAPQWQQQPMPQGAAFSQSQQLVPELQQQQGAPVAAQLQQFVPPLLQQPQPQLPQQQVMPQGYSSPRTTPPDFDYSKSTPRVSNRQCMTA